MGGHKNRKVNFQTGYFLGYPTKGGHKQDKVQVSLINIHDRVGVSKQHGHGDKY